MKKYNIGDRVTIRRDLCCGEKYRIHCSKSMEGYRGKTFFIVEIHYLYDNGKHYTLSKEKNIVHNSNHYEELRDWTWTCDMFEKAETGILDKMIKVKVLKVRRKV